MTTTLAPAASTTCSANYTVTQADLDNGTVKDSATVVGTPPSGPPTPPSAPSTVTIPVTQVPAITIAKSSTTSVITLAGQVVVYSFLVTNTGNVTLTNVSVTDTQTSPSLASSLGPISCPVTTLAPTASTTCSANYTVTQADVDHGSTHDSATATGTPPTGTPPVSPPATLTIPATPLPAMTVVKSSTTTAITHVGQVVPYAFLVTNTGNVTLTNVTVTDVQALPSINGILSATLCPVTTLAPAASTTCTANYTVSQGDYDQPTLQDSATVIGTPPSGPPTPPSTPSTVIIPVTPAPALTIVKSATPASVGAAGNTVTYRFQVTNTGNVALTAVAVTETAFSGTGTMGVIACGPTNIANGSVNLAIGDTITCAATYVVTQADVDSGIVTNTATASGTPPVGSPVTSPPSNATVTAVPGPMVAVVKATNTTAVTAVGQHVTYTFTVTNTGNVTLTHVTVTDAQTAPAVAANLGPITCGPTAIANGAPTLAPGASIACTATYTVSAADLANATLTDSATVIGTPPNNPPIAPSPPSKIIVAVIPPVSNSGNGLAYTGAPVVQVFSVALGLLIAGLALLLAGRRREREED